MGNLNCFKDYQHQSKSKWYDEWQNNSSYQRPYNYYDRNYCDRVNENEFAIDQDVMNNYYPNSSFSAANYPGYATDVAESRPYNDESNNYNMPMTQYYLGEGFGRDTNMPCENFNIDFDNNKSVQDNVQEAFMSDWFVREEAELNCNVKALQKGDMNSLSNEELFCDEVVKTTKSHAKKEVKVVDELQENTSDSDMCSIEGLGKTDNKNGALMGFTTKKNDKCCYTAYIMCNNSVEWDNFLKRSARIMTGLQRQFSCIIKFSDKISFHRGNSVRTFQIIGSHKGNVIRCKAALPKMVSKMLITSMTCSAEVEEYSKECTRDSRSTLNRKMRAIN